MRLSIIIPVYNVEQWVGRCLESCLNQDIPKEEYEIICVDDGSNDDSMRIVEHYAKEYKNIVLLYQENAGQSAARNFGMHHAKGEYVWFVDSDDWIESNCIGTLLNDIEQDNLEVLCFSFQYVEEGGEVHPGRCPQKHDGTIMTGREFIVQVHMPAGPWVAIHSKEFLERANIRFIEGITREDEDFTMRAYYSADRIKYIETVAYNYFQRNGSTMKSARTPKTAYNLLKVADSLYSFAVTRENKTSAVQNILMNRVSFAFSQALAYHCDGEPPLTEFQQKPYYPLKINSQLSKSLRYKYRLINMSLRLYLLIYKLVKR